MSYEPELTVRRKSNPLETGLIVCGLGFALLVYFAPEAEAFWTRLLEIVIGACLLLNWRVIIMPHAYIQHFIKYNFMFRFLAVSALLPAALLAGVPAPFLFVGMLLYAFYVTKAEPWTKEMRELSAMRWNVLLVVIALGIAAIVGGLQMKRGETSDDSSTQRQSWKPPIYDCATQALLDKKVTGGAPSPCEDNSAKRAAMNTNVASGTFPVLTRVLKYWFMLTALAIVAMATNVLLMAKRINLALDTLARTSLVQSGIPQNDKNVAEFLKGDIRTQNAAIALCEQRNIHPALLRFAGKSPELYEKLTKIPAVLSLPLALSFFPCLAMFIPSLLNCTRFQASPPSESKVLRGFGLRRLDGTLE